CMTAALASAGGRGSPQRCRDTMARLLGPHPNGKPILRTIDLYCRDGDPHCDRDGICDGTCTVAFCQTDGNYIGGCPFLGLMWANDFPHSDSTWPCSQELLAREAAHLTADERDRILHDNVSELYGLDA